MLTQEEANLLIQIEKHAEAANSNPINLPDLGGKISVPLISANRREHFSLDLSKGRIELSKGKNQLRARQVLVLLRLDFGGPPHRNPDEEEIPSPHLHIYREGFDDKWAFPVPPDKFSKLEDYWQTLQDFLGYCNVTERPDFRKGLFT